MQAIFLSISLGTEPRPLREWVRVLRRGGSLEIWLPDGLKIAQAFVTAETYGADDFNNDGWFPYNDEQDPCKWAAGRIFSVGDGTGNINHSNWHRAFFSPRFLKKCLEQAGLANVRRLDRTEVRGYDHGWINLGMTGTKP